MTDELDWFDRWVKYHTTVFGMDREQDVTTFLSWRNLFVRAGFTEEELTEATEWIAMNDPPQWRSEHLAAIQKRVRHQRLEARERPKEPNTGPAYPSCPDCFGCAWASVPHLQFVAAGVWDGFTTFAVLCSCAWGNQEWQRRSGSKHKAMNLAAYERHNPRWREQMAAASAEQKAMRHAENAAEATTQLEDKRRGPLPIGRTIQERLRYFRGEKRQ